MLCRTLKKAHFKDRSINNDFLYILKSDDNSNFSDNNMISKYTGNSVCFMADNGLVKGTDNNCFEPFGIATKEQAIIIYLRCFLTYSNQKPELLDWSTNFYLLNHGFDNCDSYFVYDKELLYHFDESITDGNYKKLTWIDNKGYCYLDGTVYISATEYYDYTNN